jgi:hypothetical protein
MNVIFDVVLIVSAWIGMTITFAYVSDQVAMRWRQNRMYNELRYPRRHR